MKFRALAVALAVAASLAYTATPATADPGERAIFMRVYDGHPSDGKVNGAATGKQLFSHGGAVETTPAVYISWWGTEWTAGFTGGGGVSSATAQSYVKGFYSNVGGSSWIASTSQYCQGVPSRTVTCPSSAQFIGNPTGQLKGTFNDTTPVPATPSQTDIASAALRLMAATGGYNANATYFVFTPSGKSMSGFATSWCAWHSSTSSPSGRVAYAYMPFQPDAGGNCGANFVNAGSQGLLDGFSIVGGHEYAEAQTDPFPNSGWLDQSNGENGDKCAWSPSTTNISLAGSAYAVQPLWSNKTGNCVITYP